MSDFGTALDSEEDRVTRVSSDDLSCAEELSAVAALRRDIREDVMTTADWKSEYVMGWDFVKLPLIYKVNHMMIKGRHTFVRINISPSPTQPNNGLLFHHTMRKLHHLHGKGQVRERRSHQIWITGGLLVSLA